MNNSCKLLLLVWMAPFYCNACPNCIGTVDEDSAPFFSDECYQGEQQQNNQSILAPEKGEHHE